MKKQWYALFFSICLTLMLASCGRVAVDASAVRPTPLPADTSGAEGVSSQPEPEDPFAACPFGLEGLTLYEPGQETQPGGLSLLATLQNDARGRDGYFWLQGVYDLSSSNLVLLYAVSDQQINIQEGYYDNVYGDIQVQKYLASYDLETGQVLQRLALPSEESFSYLEQAGNILWNWEQTTDRVQAIGYDAELQESRQILCSADTYGSFSPSGETFYTVSDKTIWQQPSTRDGQPEPIELQQSFSVDYLNGVFLGPQGEMCAVLGGMATDLKSYYGIANLDTGEFLYLDDSYSASLHVDNGALVSQLSSDNGLSNCYVVYTGTVPYTYDWSGEEYLNLTVLSGGKLLFHYTETDGSTSVLHLNLYDGNTGALEGCTSLTVTERYAWFACPPVLYPGRDALLLPINSETQHTWCYLWDYREQGEGISGMTVTETEVPHQLVPDLGTQWDPTSFVPQECPEELSDLRARADALEEQLGIRILISTECRNIIGDYAIEDLSDRETLEQALDQLEYEAQKYPEGFFRQFSCGWISGIDVYLTGQLIGTSSYVLDYAGGFQTSQDDRLVLAIDCTYPWNIATTFHHELSHAIDTKINMDWQVTRLDGEAWAALNPPEAEYGDSYTYRYAQYGREEMQCFIYDGINNENAYFVDDYSMTFPTEDRARLFENIMVDESRQWIDWDSAPHLREKLNYFAQCIRASFDTTGWEDVPWEVYLEEDAESENAA